MTATPSILEQLPCSLPPARDVSVTDDDATKIGKRFESKLGTLEAGDLTEDVVWRDLFSLTGSLRTFYGSSNVLERWKALTQPVMCSGFTFQPNSTRIVRLGEEFLWVEARYTFQTQSQPATECTAMVSYANVDGKWRIWVLRTILDRLKDHPSVDQYVPCRQNGEHKRGLLSKPQDYQKDVWDCVVVGGGQAGLSVAGRLQSQGISYVVLEKNAHVGDNWKLRYQSTKLHTTRESSHLPFDRTFPACYPEFLTKDDLAQGYQDWVTKYDINVWVNTGLILGEWRADESLWHLQIVRDGEAQTTTARHVVLAVGAGCQIPVMPEIEGHTNFKGIIQHSATFTSADEWRGKAGVVVGTANTAHDVAEDMCAAGMSSVTMIQRSPTYVLPYEYYQRILDVLYNDKTPTHLADTLSNTNPIPITRLISKYALHGMAKKEPERFDALEKAGFLLIRYGDIIHQLYERFGGHYMDVGASSKIAKGLIGIKSGARPTKFVSDGLLFDDGTKLDADVVVFATGFLGNMKSTVQDLFGPQVAAQIDDFWGLDSEGEIRGAFKPSGREF
ncbi:hypothetical protein LTS17_008294 [Exophiala oligosperma]